MSRCSVEQAVDAVAKELPATAVLVGQETWLKNSALERLLGSVRIEMPEFNLTNFDGMPDFSLLQAALGKPPFMSPNKAVVLRIGELLSTAGNASQSEPLMKMRPAPGTLFVIVAGDKLDRRKAYVKRLETEALIVECAPLTNYAGGKFVSQAAREKGVHIRSEIASALFERCEGDLYRVENELDKLAAVCVGEITRKELDEYGPASPETSIFAIEDLFLAKKYEQASEAVASLLEREPSPFGFLRIVTNAFRCMLVARSCRDARFAYARTIALICETVGCRDWLAKKAYDRSARFTADKLRKGVEKLARIDFMAKQGEINLRSDLYPLLFQLYAG